MKPTLLPNLAVIAYVAMSFQTAVFAGEHLNPDEENVVALEPGMSLPILDIEVGGEISVNQDDIVQLPWSSKSFESKGKVQLVQYIAANHGAARQNKAFTDTLIEKKFSSDQLSTTIIVQMADTMGFMKSLVVNRLAKNKAKHQTINFIVDDNGVGLQRWGMKHKSYAIIVLDASGKVLFFKDGPLSEIEIANTIQLLENQIS